MTDAAFTRWTWSRPTCLEFDSILHLGMVDGSEMLALVITKELLHASAPPDITRLLIEIPGLCALEMARGFSIAIMTLSVDLGSFPSSPFSRMRAMLSASASRVLNLD